MNEIAIKVSHTIFVFFFLKKILKKFLGMGLQIHSLPQWESSREDST